MHFSKQEFIKKVKQLLYENTSPEGIGLGAAIGVFIGLTPFYGLHTLIALGMAFLIKKANKIAMLLGIQISIPPVVPFIYILEYKIGKFFLLMDDHYNEKFSDTDLSLYAKMNLKFFATLIGSAAVGVIAAVASYFVIVFLVKKHRARIAAKRAKTPAEHPAAPASPSREREEEKVI